jgi:hypothetical protein
VITAWLTISRLGFVLQRCQLKAIRASIVLSDGTICCDVSRMKRMDWMFVSSAASAFEFLGNVGSSKRQACARTYSQHDDCTCFRMFSAIRPCCCINDWTTGMTKRTGEDEFLHLFSTSNPASDNVAMAEGIILMDVAHQRRFCFVVPAGSSERMASRGRALGSCLTNSLSTERLMLRFMLFSGEFVTESISVPKVYHIFNNSFAVDFPRFPRLAMSVTAKGMRPNAASKRSTLGSFFELRLMSWNIRRQAALSVGWIVCDCHSMVSHGGYVPRIVTRIATWLSMASFRRMSLICL